MDPGMLVSLALGAVPPGVVALVYFVAAWFRREPAPAALTRFDWRPLATPLVFAIAFVLTYCIALGVPPLRPVKSMDWLPHVALIAGAAGAVAAIDRIPAILRWLPAVGALAVAAWLSARNLIAQRWTGAETADHLVSFLLAGAVALAAAHHLASRRAGPLPVLLLLIFTGGASQLLMLGYFNKVMGQAAGISATMLVPALAVSLWRPGFRLGPGAVVFVVVMTLVPLLQGRLYGEAEPALANVYASALLLSLVGAWLTLAGLPERTRPVIRCAAVLGIAILPVAISIGIAAKIWIDAQQEPAGEYDPYS